MPFYPYDAVVRSIKATSDSKISECEHSDLGLALGTVLRKLDRVLDEIAILRQEVQQMSDANTTLDQAVADLDAAATSKITEDQTLVAEAKQGQNVAADIAKVEGIAANLNAETAAEQAVTNPAPVVPVVTPTVPVAAVGPIVTPAGQINPLPGVAVVNS